jgi:hypothetical protein
MGATISVRSTAGGNGSADFGVTGDFGVTAGRGAGVGGAET